MLRCSICLDLVGASRLVVVTIWSSPFPLHQSACNRHCRSCDSQGSCTSCRDPSKVLLFGECQYESCAPQYYLDISTKTCKGKAFPELREDSFIQGCAFCSSRPSQGNTFIRCRLRSGVQQSRYMRAPMHPLDKLFQLLQIAR